MQKLLILPALLLALSIAAQKEMKPKMGNLLNLSPQGEIAWRKQQQGCEAFFKKVADSRGGYEALSAAEKKRYDDCSESEMKGYWDAVGDGCSWYCGGGPDSVYASSELKASGGITYNGENAHDLSFKTAWVEGVPGYGVGEYLVYRFTQQSPRITDIIIANGYVKSEAAWRDNSRVKKLKMYIDNKPFAILNLADTRNEQIFTFDPIGNSNREDYEAMEKLPGWTMKFEILEVYKGAKYDETAISEIYFDGIDVHCLAAGTPITMADHTVLNIEQVAKGDQVVTYNEATGQTATTEVTAVIRKQHASLVKLSFEDREVIVTEDHPFYTAQHNWASVNPQRSNLAYLNEIPVVQLAAGLQLFLPSEKRFITLQKIEKIKGPQVTYTLELKEGTNFIANGLLVKTEPLK